MQFYVEYLVGWPYSGGGHLMGINVNCSTDTEGTKETDLYQLDQWYQGMIQTIQSAQDCISCIG